MIVRDPITVCLLGVPTAFARMRLGRTGIHFVPTEQRNVAAALRMAAAEAMRSAAAAVLDEPLSLDLLAEFPVPASWSKRRQNLAILGQIRPAKKPDVDNCVKLATDALNGIVYRDDALIVELRARKIYGVQPKLVCTVAPIFVAEMRRELPGELPLVVAA